MATDILVKVGADITDFSRKMAESNKALSNFAKSNQQTFDAFKQTGAVVTGFGVALAGGLGIAVKEAIKFEDSFAGVKKTVDATDAELAVLKKGFRDMAKEIPASVHEINAVGEAAGQLGIKTENILDFTRVMIDLGEATNLTSDEAATAFARFANIVGMSQNDFDKLGSTVVALGNNFATTEAEIVEMSMRLAGVGKQVGMTESDIMALSTAMSSVGIEAEAGGSAMSMAIKKMQNAVSSGGKDLDNFAKAAGMTSKEFADSFDKDPIRALDAFIKGLAKSGEEGENLNEILESVGIKGIREADTMLRLAGASDILSEAVDLASTAWEENTALSDEAAQRYETIASKLKILKNNVIDAAVTFGEALMPAVTAAVDGLQKLAKWFGGLSESTKQFIAVGTAVTAALALIIGPLMLLIGFIPQIVSGFGVVMTVVKAVSGVFAALASPIGLAVLAIVGIAAAVVIAYKKVEWFRDAVNAAWDWIKEKTMVAFEAVKEAVLKAVGAIVEFAKEKLDTLKQFWAENGEQIRQATENVWNFIKGIIEKVMPIIEGIIKAVWFVIQTVVMAVWENIKGVIDGALNIILGLVKTFSSLFTGDWSGMWEGVKQLFSGAIELLWNAVQLMLWGRLLKGIAVFAGSFRGAVTGMWSSVQAVFTNTINAIKSFFTAGFNAMKNVANTTMGSMRSIITSVWNTIKGVFTSVVNSIKSTISSGFSNVVSTIRTKMTEAVTAVKTKMTEMLGKVTGAAKDFLQAGKDLVQGLIDGITQMTAAAIGAITGVVDSVVEKAKSLLKIKSPSRVFKQIGEYTGEGLAQGIAGTYDMVERASAKLAQAAVPDISMEYVTPEGIRSSLSSAVNGTVDVSATENNRLLAEIRDELRRQKQMIVEMDSREVGRAVSPTVDRELGRRQANSARRAFT